jgi:hypothetical protein
MQTTAASAIATYIEVGTSRTTRAPWSRAKKVYHGSLSPVCRNVPIEASSRSSSMGARPASAAADTIIDLLTKPLKKGTPEMEKAPIIMSRSVHFIGRASCPSSVSLPRPVA